MDLIENPFHVLGASPRDDRRRIMELADERSLLLDSHEVAEARANLTNPRKRLAAEVAWLPGIGPKRADEMLSLVESAPDGLLTVDKLSSIARANLLSAGLAQLPNASADDLVQWILDLSRALATVDSDELRAIINEERIVSGFPEIHDIAAVETEIEQRRRHYGRVIKSALDNLPPKQLIYAVTVVVELATDGGEKHGPILVADLVESYEVEAQEFLDKEEENIRALAERLREAVDAERHDSVIAPMVDQLSQVVRNWDTVAQPIQVSAQSRGLDHDASHRVAGLVRGLAIHSYNEHERLDISQQLTSLLQEVFAEVGDVAEQTAEDADALAELAERRKLSALLDPISDLCRTALENSERNPSSAESEARKVINSAPKLIADLSAAGAGAEILLQGNDEIALTLMHCAVSYGNKTEKWKSCISILEQAMKCAGSEEVKSRIQTNIETAKGNDRLYGDLTPISSAPGLYTINGIGTTMYGSTDHDPASGSYISTYYFAVLFMPIFPISRYRVIPTGKGYRFLGKAPLRTFDKCHLGVSMALIALLVFSMQ